MFTIRVTDDMINDWCNVTGSAHYSDQHCPLATALKAELERRGTPVTSVLNASSVDGSIIYQVGAYYYKTHTIPQDRQPARKFIYTVDYQHDKMPRKRVFHYTTPMPVRPGADF